VTKGGLLANIAYRRGEQLYEDDDRERFTGRGDAARDAEMQKALEAGVVAERIKGAARRVAMHGTRPKVPIREMTPCKPG